MAGKRPNCSIILNGINIKCRSNFTVYGKIKKVKSNLCIITLHEKLDLESVLIIKKNIRKRLDFSEIEWIIQVNAMVSEVYEEALLEKWRKNEKCHGITNKNKNHHKKERY